MLTLIIALIIWEVKDLQQANLSVYLKKHIMKQYQIIAITYQITMFLRLLDAYDVIFILMLQCHDSSF